MRARRDAALRKLEQQRIHRAERRHHRQRQLNGIGGVARPDVMPFRAGFKAMAGDRLAVIEGRVRNFFDAVLPDFAHGKGKERVKGRVAGTRNHLPGLFAICHLLRQIIA